jgi:hypothetical protein
MWRHAWGDGAHCPSTARHAAFNDHIFPGSLSKITNLENLVWCKLAPPPVTTATTQITLISF